MRRKYDDILDDLCDQIMHGETISLPNGARPLRLIDILYDSDVEELYKTLEEELRNDDSNPAESWFKVKNALGAVVFHYLDGSEWVEQRIVKEEED